MASREISRLDPNVANCHINVLTVFFFLQNISRLVATTKAWADQEGGGVGGADPPPLKNHKR